MNMRMEIVTHETALRQLCETMRAVASVPGRTADEAVEALQAHYAGHLFVNGRFTSKKTIWNFPEIIFEGDVAGERITHTIWC